MTDASDLPRTDEPSRGDDSRSRLLEAAVAAFAAKGFHGTTTRDIAAGAGMSPAALYVHHRSKEELLHLISRAGHEATLDLVRRAAASSPDPVEQLRRLVHDYVVDHARDHTLARIVNYELGALSAEHRAEIREIRRAIDSEVRRVVQRGVDEGRFSTPDPALAATTVLSLGIDVARWYRPDGRWSPEQIGSFYADAALRLVGVGSSRPTCPEGATTAFPGGEPQ